MQIFVNLPVKDLKKSQEFFSALGFKFNPQFTDENAACMIIDKNIFVMLLLENFFKTFINKKVSDSHQTTEVINALSADSRDKVDEMLNKVLKAGGNEPRPAQDHGWMYGRSFEDLDGHSWEVFYMNESQMPEEMKKREN